jgi:hypothetical protein
MDMTGRSTIQRRLAWGAVLFGAWWLVQVPSKDVRLSNPGSNMPPITQFKRVREFASAGDCEPFRDANLQDGALIGSDAILDQASSLRCVPAEALAAPTAAASPPLH